MNKYLKLFTNHSAYSQAESSLDKPNVSYCVQENEVHYNPIAPDPSGGHAFVEIGGIKWATMNVGANSITDYGLYFQWGDTQGYTADQVGTTDGKKAFNWADYKFSIDGSSSNFSKYNSTDGKTVLDAEDDAVNAAWGGNWRMPTTAELQALGEAVNTAWTQVNGVSGLMCTDKTDETNTLFFPAGGYSYSGSSTSVNSFCNYWSSSLYTSKEAYGVNATSFGGAVWSKNNDRNIGRTIRGVLVEN